MVIFKVTHEIYLIHVKYFKIPLTPVLGFSVFPRMCTQWQLLQLMLPSSGTMGKCKDYLTYINPMNSF